MVMKVIAIMRVSNENNEQQQLQEGFANICYKIVLPILLQKLIKLLVFKVLNLLVEDVGHGFLNENHIFQEGTTLFNRST